MKPKNDPNRFGLDKFTLLLMVNFAAVYLAVLTFQMIFRPVTVENSVMAVATSMPIPPTITPPVMGGGPMPTPTNALSDWNQVYMTRGNQRQFPADAPVRISHSYYVPEVRTTFYGVYAVLDDSIHAEVPEGALYSPAPQPTATALPDAANWGPGTRLWTVERVGDIPLYTPVTLQSIDGNLYTIAAQGGMMEQATVNQLVERYE